MSVFRRPPVMRSRACASTVRSRNDGAESETPRLARAIPPALIKNLRFIITPFVLAVSFSRLMKSVPPRGSGWVLATHPSSYAASTTHPLPRGGTDFIQRTHQSQHLAICLLSLKLRRTQNQTHNPSYWICNAGVCPGQFPSALGRPTAALHTVRHLSRFNLGWSRRNVDLLIELLQQGIAGPG